jgi:hypothetical protein
MLTIFRNRNEVIVDLTMSLEHRMEVLSHSSAINVFPNQVAFQSASQVLVTNITYYYFNLAAYRSLFFLRSQGYGGITISISGFSPERLKNKTYASEC